MFFENAPVGYQSLDEEGRFIEVNDRWTEILGYQREEVIGQWFGDFLAKKYVDGFRERFKLFKSLGRIHSEFEMIRKDGTPIFVAFDGRIGYTPDGAFKQTHCVLDNISERVKAENLLKESEERFRNLFELSPVGKSMTGIDGSLHVNKAFCDMLGYSEEEMLNRTWQDITLPEDAKQTNEVMQQLIDGHATQARFEKRYVHKNGSIVWADVSTTLYRKEGVSQFFVTSAINITDRKHTEEKLRESEEKYRALVEVSSEAIFINQRNRITYLNRAALQLFGAETPEQVIGKTPFEVFHPDIHQTIKDRIERMFKSEMVAPILEEKIVRLDGTVVDVEVTATSFRIQGELVIQVILRDITERKRAEAALVASEKEFRLLAEAMPQIVWITQPDGWNIYFNQQWTDYTGMTMEESLGHGWNKPFHPDDQHRAWDAWQNAVKTHGKYSLECRLRRSDGVYRWWLIRGVPVMDENGQVAKWFGTCTDIEELKQVEEQNRQQIDELRRWYAVTLDREDRIQQLKKEVNELLTRQGEKERYAIEL